MSLQSFREIYEIDCSQFFYEYEMLMIFKVNGLLDPYSPFTSEENLFYLLNIPNNKLLDLNCRFKFDNLSVTRNI